MRFADRLRKFDEALRGQGKSKKKGAKRPAKESRARQALSQIQALYRIEREFKEANGRRALCREARTYEASTRYAARMA